MSAQKSKPTSVIGALFGFVGFSVLAGLLVTIGVTPAIAVAGMTASSSIGVFESIPEYIEIGKLSQRNTLYAKQGGQDVPFATLYSENRVELKWDQVSPNLKNAVLAGEDRRFYDHGGVDVTSLVRAAVGSLGGGELGASGGGSTLTMQLVRNIRIAQSQQLDTQEERDAAYKEATTTTLDRKLEEMKFAIGLEKKYTKDSILLAYLNIAYFGDQTYGVQAAAQHYYNKSATDLTVEEAASLIAIVQYPDTRNLSTPEKYEGNKARRDVILKSMKAEGYIDEAQMQASLASDIAGYVHLTTPTQGCAAVTAAGAQYFCDYVKKNIKNLAVLGSSPEEREKNWATGGYNVYTTLDLDLTASAKEKVDRYAPATETRLQLGSVVNTVEAGTGRVLVMAQNTTFSEVASDDRTQTSVNFSTDQQYGGSGGFQPGSTYKPFTLLDWLEQGNGVNQSVNATPRTFQLTADGRPTVRWTPKNDAGEKPGSMTVAAATAQSMNTAYAAMASQLDLADIAGVAEKLGVHRADGKPLAYENPSSILGSNEVAPLTMATAYAAIAAGGKYCESIIVDNIKDAAGTDIGGQPQACTQALDPDVAAGAARAMSGLWTSGTAVGGLPADGIPEIGKTGTTDDKDQIWIIGASTRVATAIWQGNYDFNGGKKSLRAYSSPVQPRNGSYANARSAFFREVQTVNNAAYPGGAFAAPSNAVLRGTGVSVPDLAGSTPSAAQTLLRSTGLKYEDGGVQASTLPAGQVSGSDPAGGTLVAKGSTVRVFTSDGSLATTVPDLVGQDLKGAGATVAGAGFTTALGVSGFTTGDGKNQCRVASSDPAAGTSVAKDTAISVVLYGGKDGNDPGGCS
ncbi:membrane peptidoglycan carboxypeptidase [Frigoribacterium sp. PvP120]|jgi:membrane peptidoglycan carboxypeptidase|uniref:transglycosylase domain-containing protein n=1 Tax=unclassified Frigoribacterium TaxID=2627005 RepID=UPI001AE69273|nr:transglycosylase domain-containing protein [Frigoribacterium sp. PvP121]MBP1241226.1 membrane peptidoglycan carboxypeptidase [Frigoribacterium sp. PvP121]